MSLRDQMSLRVQIYHSTSLAQVSNRAVTRTLEDETLHKVRSRSLKLEYQLG